MQNTKYADGSPQSSAQYLPRGLKRGDRLGQLVNRGGEISDLRLELVDVALLQLLLALVRVQRIRAEVLVLDLVLLLLQQGLDHLIDGGLHFRERIQADAARKRRQTRAVKGLRRLEQHLRSRVARGLLLLRLAAHLHEVERAGERRVRLVARQDGKRLAARLDLLLPGIFKRTSTITRKYSNRAETRTVQIPCET